MTPVLVPLLIFFRDSFRTRVALHAVRVSADNYRRLVEIDAAIKELADEHAEREHGMATLSIPTHRMSGSPGRWPGLSLASAIIIWKLGN